MSKKYRNPWLLIEFYSAIVLTFKEFISRENTENFKMKGSFDMKKLYAFTAHCNKNIHLQQHLFLLLSTLFWTLVPFTATGMIGLLFGLSLLRILAFSLTAAGFGGIFIGFFGGFLFLFRESAPSEDCQEAWKPEAEDTPATRVLELPRISRRAL